MAAVCTKLGVLGAPQPANTIDVIAAIRKFRIVASKFGCNGNESKLEKFQLGEPSLASLRLLLASLLASKLGGQIYHERYYRRVEEKGQ